MPSIIEETRNYMDRNVSILLRTPSSEYHEKRQQFGKEFETLTKQIKSHLPKIKGFLIDVGVDHNTPYESVYSYKQNLIADSIIEFQLDKSKRTKEWLDNRINEISAKCIDYQNEVLTRYRKELSLAKRRANRFIRSR